MPELLGICVVYLGGLNYFLTVDEQSPIVSKIGTTDGELRVHITPYVSNTSNPAAIQLRTVKHEQSQGDGDGAKKDDDDGFVCYEHKELDNSEEQVYEYMDRTLQYRVRVDAIYNLKQTRKFSHVFVRYAFFKAGSTQTECQVIVRQQEEKDTGYVSFQHERRFAVDVNDEFVKYVSSNNLTLECMEPEKAWRVMVSKQKNDPHTSIRVSSHSRFTSKSSQLLKANMAQPLRDVDAIWREMQQSTLQVDVARLLRRSAATSSSTKNNAKAKKMNGCTVTKTSALSGPSPTASVTQTIDSLGSHEPQQVVLQPFSLQRELNRLADEHPSVRKKAALALEAHFLQPCTQVTTTASTELDDSQEAEEDSTFSELAKPLFKRFNDPVEKVRDVCIRVVTLFIAKEQDLLRFIPYLMPAIANRINSQYGFDEENQQFTRDQFLHDAFKRGRIFVDEDKVSRIKPEEPSEEIRLLFLDLVSALLENAFKCNASSILHAYMFDVLVILVSGLHDHFHEVNIKSCAILRSISNNMVSVMKHFSVAVVRAAKDLLLHRLARVRIAAIDTIRALVTCPNRDKCKGSGTEAIVDLIGHRDENVIPISAFYTSEIRLNYFAKLDQDANALVRKAFFDMVSDWITNLPDRYDHESRLMPYLLSAVSDENDEISKSAMQTLAFLGTRYEQEHGEDVLEMKQYGVDGKNPVYNYHKRLPRPFLDQRPSLGTRLYVRGRARRFLNPILRELDNWQSKTRSHAVRLLKSIVVYCEETITVDVHLLIQTLLRVWREPEIAEELKIVAELVGRFAAPDTYMSLILARIRGDAEVVAGGIVSPEQTATGMELLGLLMEGSLDKTLLPHVNEILETISTKHILDFESSDIKRALGELVQHLASLLERRGREAVSAYFLQHGRLPAMERVYDRLFEVALVVARAQNSSSEAVACANETLDALTRLEPRKNTTELFDVHFSKSFTHVTAALSEMTAVQWTRKCCEQLLLEELLRRTSVEAILVELPVVQQLFQNALMLESPLSVNAALTSDEEQGMKGTPADGTKVQTRGGASERKAAYTDLLQALLARMERHSECDSSAPVQSSDVLQTLQAFLLTSQAAAA